MGKFWTGASTGVAVSTVLGSAQAIKENSPIYLAVALAAAGLAFVLVAAILAAAVLRIARSCHRLPVFTLGSGLSWVSIDDQVLHKKALVDEDGFP